MKKTNTKTIVMIGMFAAVLAVLSQISIPMPSGVPVTLQTFRRGTYRIYFRMEVWGDFGWNLYFAWNSWSTRVF